MTLNDYANDRNDVVLFWVSVGCPTGDYTPLGYPDLDFAERRGLLELNGTVDEANNWHWDGKGSPTDDQLNSITKLHAYADAWRWAAIIEEYESIT